MEINFFNFRGFHNFIIYLDMIATYIVNIGVRTGGKGWAMTVGNILSYIYYLHTSVIVVT